MINNGDAIGRLRALLHLRRAHEDRPAVSAWMVSCSVCGGIMSGTRRVRASRQNLPRLQGIMRHPSTLRSGAVSVPLEGAHDQ